MAQNEQHELRSLSAVSETQAAYECTCGAKGTASIGWAGDDAVARARLNHAQHARNASVRAKAKQA